MTENLAVDLLLGLAVGLELVCVAGLLLARSTADRLHFVAAASTVAPVLILAALIVREGLPSNILEAIVAIAILLLANSVLIHALGRTAHGLERGS